MEAKPRSEYDVSRDSLTATRSDISKAKNGVVIATDKKLPTILVDESTNNKIALLSECAGTKSLLSSKVDACLNDLV